jgi:hypothetical protein
MSSRDSSRIAEMIQDGQCVLGIELGSTRINAVLIDAHNTPAVSGGHGWENTLNEGIWTYPRPGFRPLFPTCRRVQRRSTAWLFKRLKPSVSAA